MAYISGDGFSVNPNAEKTFDVTNADSVNLSFNWRASSGCACSSTTNFRLMILDTSGNTLSSQTLQAGGTTDTGIQSYSADITSIISGHDSIVIRMWLNDSWGSNWNRKIWWDNVDLQVTTSQQDIIPPTLTIPNDITIEATGQSTIVNIGTATDDIDPNPVITNNSTSSFSVGITRILWTATDSSNNFSTTIQTIIVQDTTSPTLTIPNDITTETTGQFTNVNIGLATAIDNSDPNPTITNNAPSSFSLGITTIIWTATDDSGNYSTATQTVIIQDTTPPTLTIPNDITIEATGEQTTVNIGTATVTDLVDQNPTITNNAVTSYPYGITTIIWTATDSSGNISTKIQTVTIPDPRKPTQGDTPLNELDNWIMNHGGIYFGIGIFTFGFIIIGVMASPKTVPIFTIILMILSGLLHVTGIFILPAWFWGIIIILAITLVLKRKK